MITTHTSNIDSPEIIPSLLEKCTPLVRGGVYLLDGKSGTGKSTLLLSIAADLVRKSYRVLYVCGEEEPEQVINRCKRLNITEEIGLTEQAILQLIAQDIEEYNPDVVCIDSIQSIRNMGDAGIAGGIAQLRIAVDALVSLAKEKNVTLILIGQQTKDGQAAGSQRLVHMVDTHLRMFADGSVRGVFASKNRFGAVGKGAFFYLTSKGMIPT